MNFTQESKSQLAKLLASEDITVEHRKVSTAMFDLKTRTLICPIWKDMSGDLYDLLLGHEVGHALETPEQGWHNAVSSKDEKISRNFRAFLNVVEDARIEKKMKRRFPGLRQPMIRGYNELLEKNFFGINGRDVNTLPFVDRLNIYTKGGVSLGINFNDEETEFLRQVESCETWEDVERVTALIFDYSKQEQQELSEAMKNLAKSLNGSNSDSDEFDNESDSDGSQDEYDGDGSSDSDQENSDDMTPSKQGKTSSDAKNGEFNDDDSDEQSINRWKESNNSNGGFEPKCATDDAFRENEYSLIDAQSLPFVYVSPATPNLDKVITPHTRVHQLMDKHWNEYYALSGIEEKKNRFFNEFRKRNDRYISLLAKEFEMRKAASKFAKQKVSESGDIDVSRIYKYQIDDNIFRKVSRVPKGKSHGLVMLFDRSGSMSYNMRQTIEQMMILVMFCRKVNIPFVVYGFGNDMGGYCLDKGVDDCLKPQTFKNLPGELVGSDVFLREYLNSNMSAGTFNHAMKNMATLAKAYYGQNYGREVSIPKSETLSNTPLMEAMFALAPITKEFRKKCNLDIVNTVVLHDGDADSIWSFVSSNDRRSSFNPKKETAILRDNKNKIEIKMKSGGAMSDDSALELMQASVFEWYRKVTDSKLIGFFLINDTGRDAGFAIRQRYVSEKGNTYHDYFGDQSYSRNSYRDTMIDSLKKQIKTERFLESNNRGYNKFFIVPSGGDVETETDEMAISGTVTASKLKNAFIKMNKTKQVSRVLVNRFIGEIAV